MNLQLNFKNIYLAIHLYYCIWNTGLADSYQQALCVLQITPAHFGWFSFMAMMLYLLCIKCYKFTNDATYQLRLSRKFSTLYPNSQRSFQFKQELRQKYTVYFQGYLNCLVLLAGQQVEHLFCKMHNGRITLSKRLLEENYVKIIVRFCFENL